MSTGLLTQLETYFSEVDAAQEPIRPGEVAALVDVVRELPPMKEVGPIRGPRIAVAAAVAILLVVGGLAWLTRSSREPDVTDEPPPTTTIEEHSTTTIHEKLEPAPIDSVESFEALIHSLLRLVGTPGAVWGLDARRSLARFDIGAAEFEVVDIPEAFALIDIASTGDAVWVSVDRRPAQLEVVRLDAESLLPSEPIELPGVMSGGDLIAADGALWASLVGGVSRIDTSTLAVETIEVPERSLSWIGTYWIGADEGRIWAFLDEGPDVSIMLMSIDLATLAVQTSLSPFDHTYATLAAQGLWMFEYETLLPSLVRFGLPDVNQTDILPVAHGADAAMATDGTSLWITHPFDGLVTRIDIDSRQIIDVVDVPASEFGGSIHIVDGTVWVVGAEETLTRIAVAGS